MKCYDCPRACGADRDCGQTGYCRCGAKAVVNKFIERFTYEEPCLGEVAAVFFGGCNLGCSYCQNAAISRTPVGEQYEDGELAALFDKAQTLDLVTPTPWLSAIERALPLCRNSHRVVYNTSGYETAEAVKRAAKFTHVFLTDFKYADDNAAARYSNARDYKDTAMRALVAMREAAADEWETASGKKLLKRGLIVRHLVLPGNVENSVKALDLIKERLGTDTVISLMSQFTPNGAGEPNEKLKKIEYKIVANHALSLGFENGYFQEFDSADCKYTPDFA